MELAEIGFEGEGVTHCQELGGGGVFDVNLERDRDFLPTLIKNYTMQCEIQMYIIN